MATQREMNRDMWVRLQEAGFVPGSALELDVFFVADAAPDASSLGDALERRGYEVDVMEGSVGIIRRRRRWTIGASRRMDDGRLESLDELVDDMESLALEVGATFDGWGAEFV